MPRLTSLPVALAMALFVSIGATGCDPEAPGARGMMTLDPGVDPTTFQTLVLRTFANKAGPYDPSMPIPADAYADEEALAAIEFPYHYEVGGGIGSSDVGDWQMVAWLSHRTPVDLTRATAFDPGDPRCSVAYRVGSCGLGPDGFCGVTGGVNCVLAATAQASP